MIIAIANGKGGVGKSTISVHAAVWLKKRGYKLAVVDADAQASTAEWLATADPEIRLERCETREQLADRLPRLTSLHDIVLIDGPAGLSPETVTLIAAADLVLLPIGPSMMDVRASYRTARLIYKIRLRDTLCEKPRAFTILNRVQPRTRLARIAVEAVRNYGFPVATTPLQLRQAYAEACGRSSVVWNMGPPARAAANEIDTLFSQVFSDRLMHAAQMRALNDATAAHSHPAETLITPNTPQPTSPEPQVGQQRPHPAAQSTAGS